jgi:anti-sigma factor RsiW
MTSDIHWIELVELVMDYLEGALDDERRQAIETHLSTCGGCRVYVEQMRQTSQLLGYLPPQKARDLPDEVRRDLLAAFRAGYPH